MQLAIFLTPINALQALSARGASARSHPSSRAVGELARRDRGGGAHTGRAQEKQRWPEAVRTPSCMFRMLVLQALNNLSDQQVEYQVRDRLSFSRFLGLAIEDSIPDATTLSLLREKLAEAGTDRDSSLSDRFDQRLAAKG